MTDIAKSARDAEKQVENLRNEIDGIIFQLGQRLRPAQIGRNALGAVQEKTPDWLSDTVRFAVSPAGLTLAAAAGAGVASTLFARHRRQSRHRRRNGWW